MDINGVYTTFDSAGQIFFSLSLETHWLCQKITTKSTHFWLPSNLSGRLNNSNCCLVVMAATGRYHEPIATALCEKGIYVSILNPILIKQSGGGSIRKVKSDKKDALKIAKYGIDNWNNLREHTFMETTLVSLPIQFPE